MGACSVVERKDDGFGAVDKAAAVYDNDGVCNGGLDVDRDGENLAVEGVVTCPCVCRAW